MPGPAAACAPEARPALVIAVLSAGTFLMGTSEFVVAGLLPEVAATFGTTTARAGLAVTSFAVGMILGAPSTALLTLRLPRRVTLLLALLLFAAGHVVVALTTSFPVVLAARFATAVATGAFWSVAAVVASRVAGPAASARALGLVLGGGMLATVVGVPLGASAGQLFGWRGPFWALALLPLPLAVVLARLVPADGPGRVSASVRGEVAGLRSGPLWLTLATCAAVNAGVLSVYSFISPLLTERAGLSPSWVPVALLLFGVGALVGSVVGGRIGDTRPFAAALTTAGVSLVACAGLWTLSARPVPAVMLFTLLGLVGMSANPVLIHLAVGYGHRAPTLASAMATSMFNLGTAIGTSVTGVALGSRLGASAVPAVGVVFGAVVFVPLGALVVRRARAGAPPDGRARSKPTGDAGTQG